MNREIKFRAWDVITKEMYNNVQNHINDDQYAFGRMLEQDRFKIMQYTGLKDQNGKDIYEGDVVFVDCSSVAGSFEDGTYKVEFILPDCMFALIQMDNKCGIAFNECYLYKVIGNIHENPELL